MGFWNTIGEAAATYNGDEAGAARFHEARNAGKPDPHVEMQAKTDQILGDVKAIQGKITALGDKPDPAKLAEYNGQLAKAQQAFTDLYHPTKNPGAFQNIGRYLKKHITGKEPAPLPKSNAVTTERMTELGGYAAGAPPEADAGAKFKTQYKALTGKDAPPEVLEQFARKQGGLTEPRPVHQSDYAQGLRRFVEGEGGDPDSPTAEQEKAFRDQRATHPSNSKFSQETAVYEKQWGKKLADWSPEELSYFNQKMAYDAQRSGQSTTTKLEKDENNQLVPVTVTNTREPMKPPVDPHAPPTSAGEAKKRMPAPSGAGSSNVHVGKPLPFTVANPVETKAHNTYIAAYQLSQAADLVANEPDNAQSQKSLAVALERAAAGRFTTQALDYINKAGWSAGAEQFWNNIDNGTLPTVVMKNLIQRAHDNKIAAYDAWQESRKGTGGDSAPAGPSNGNPYR